MAEVKISQLPEAANSLPTDYFMVIQNGVNKKVRLSTLLKTLDSSDNIQINPSRNPINVQVSSSNAPYLLFVQGSADFIGVNTSTPLARLHVIGNLKVGQTITDGTSIDGIVIHSEDLVDYTNIDLSLGVGWFKPLNASRDASILIVDTGIAAGQFDLGNGLPGQYKTITFVSGQAGSKSTIRILNALGFNRVDLTNIGQGITLKCVTVSGIPKWVCVGSNGAILYTV